MKLSARKEKILKAVVDSYIDSCQPVSSLELQQRYFPDFSSATIRNELATLEELGYLTQPHISAGRVPTAAGYRFYVDRLMPRRKLSSKEINTIKQYLNNKVNDLEEIVRTTAKLISEITNLTAVSYVQSQPSDIIKNIKIVKLDEISCLFIIVTDRTVIKDAIAALPPGISEQFLYEAANHVTMLFRGHTIEEVTNADKFAKQIRKEYEKVVEAVIKILMLYGKESAEIITVEGSSKILAQPEYSNLNKARAMIELLEAKEKLVPILSNSDMRISIKIAADNELKDGMPECAIVTTTYSLGGVSIGSSGVIGPIRMDYGKVVSVLDCIGKAMASLPILEEDDNDRPK